MSDERIINHDEAHHLALLKQDESNLARCYLQMRDALRGIINHWNEFGEMMGVKDDYGFSERLDAAEKLVR